MQKRKQEQRYRRHKRVRAKVIGTKECPRLCVFKSINHIYVQLIDDSKGHTLVGFSDQAIKKKKGLTKVHLAKQVGILVAKKALEQKIKEVVFDRGGYKYHGRVQAVAEGAREAGLKF